MASSVGRMAQKVWTGASPTARNAIAGNCRSSTLSSTVAVAAAARPLPRNCPSLNHIFGPSRQSSRITRLSGEVRTISSLVPRHSATAAAYLVSKLSSNLSPDFEGPIEGYVSPI